MQVFLLWREEQLEGCCWWVLLAVEYTLEDAVAEAACFSAGKTGYIEERTVGVRFGDDAGFKRHAVPGWD